MLKRRHQHGLSLIEVMIAVAIVGLLLVIGLPDFFAFMAGLRVRTVAEGLVGAVQQARVEATKRNQSVSFRLDSVDGGGWSVILADGTVLQSRDAQEGGSVQVQFVPGGTDTITFNNLGQRTAPAAAAGLLTLSVTNPAGGACQPAGAIRCLSITIPAGGQVRMCDPQRSAGDPQAC